MAGSGAAVHERVRRGTESGTLDGRRPSVLLSLLMHVSSSVAAPSSRSLRFMMSFSFPFSGKGSRAWLPRRRMPSFPLPVIVKTLMKSGLWPAGGTGERDSRPESAFWEVPVCVWGRNAEPFVPARPGLCVQEASGRGCGTIRTRAARPLRPRGIRAGMRNHSYPRGPAGRSRVLHFSRMCLSQGEGSGIKILSSWHFPLFSSVKMKYKGQIPPEEHVGKNDACLTLITCPRQPCRYNFSHRKSISGVGSLNLFPKEYDYVLQSV